VRSGSSLSTALAINPHFSHRWAPLALDTLNQLDGPA